MQYKTILDATFLSRPNRFIAKVLLDGKEETVHVKNTGRCKELLLPGADVRLEVSDNPARKTKYDLVAVRKEGLGWVNIDSQAPNKVVKEWLETQGFDAIHPEFSYGKSRIDFAMEKAGQLYLLEVKGCTLEVNGVGYFPDAPTHIISLPKITRFPCVKIDKPDRYFKKIKINRHAHMAAIKTFFCKRLMKPCT